MSRVSMRFLDRKVERTYHDVGLKGGVRRNESSVWKVLYRRAGISLTLQE